jgi:hypothetical protein
VETFSRETGSDPLDPWFVTGFVEGEGTFTFSRRGAQISLYFAIKLPEADRPLLMALQAFLGGIGQIYFVPPRAAARPRSGYTRAASYFRVCRRDQLIRVVEHFDSFPLRGTKRRSYDIWRQMVQLKQAFRRPPREELGELAVRLSAASVRNQVRSGGPGAAGRPENSGEAGD